ncbi:MAG: site-2 protease family protein [Acidimicrobiia bacterium]
MNRQGIRLGRAFGVPIVVDASWVVIALLITWSFHIQLQSVFRRSAPLGLWLVAALGAIVFFGSVLVHELSHSVMALRRGIGVRRIRLFVFGGASEIEQEAGSPTDELAITIAGPLASFAMGGALYLAARLIPLGEGPLSRMIGILVFINLVLGVFNLLPGFPLDGGRVLRALVWRATGDYDRATRAAVTGGRVVAFILMASGLAVVAFTGEAVGLWNVAIGWFLYQAASSGLRQLEARNALKTVAITKLMTEAPEAVAASLSLRQLVDRHLLGREDLTFPVVEDGRVRGLVWMDQVGAVPSEQWPQRRVGDVMVRLTPEDVVDDVTPSDEVLAKLTAGDRRVVVVSGERVVGIVSAADLNEWIERRV